MAASRNGSGLTCGRAKVSDLTPTATVAIKIYKHSTLKKTIAVGCLPTDSTQSDKWKC